MNQAHETEHLMRLDRIYPTGAEEWCCIYCERRVLKQHEPLEREIVLNDGVTLGGNVKDTEISEELWLALEDVLSGMDMNW
ncbi:MAG: hypothetical protein H6667_15490 [Ardenticatenaceae bacterium]|nr:hypothetical protein [Ardenticatenaceae bacterium]MCB9446062.1 hypothetical protein [Ardenticatenaceae bacterium]